MVYKSNCLSVFCRRPVEW